MFQFKFPDVGEGIAEGEIVKWRIKEGDTIKADQNIADIETDKAIVEIPSPKAGKVLKIYHKEGEKVKVGEVILDIDDGTGDSPAPAATSASPEQKKEEPKESAKDPSAKDLKEEHYTGSVVGFLEEAKDDASVKDNGVHKEARESVKATLKVRAYAKSLGVDIETVKGTGPEGRITEDDVTNSAGGAQAGPQEVVPLRGLRQKIAEKMDQSMRSSVQVTNMHDIDVTRLWDLRQSSKGEAEKQGVKLTFLAYIVKAVAEALKKNPMLNSSLMGESILLKKYYNVGIAVDTDDGLLVPVIKDADKKSLYDIAKEIVLLADKGRQRTLTLDEMKGGTFTISNLGSVGVKYFTPVLNHPESALLGLGSIFDSGPVVVDGKMGTRKMMPISLTYDHRLIDGSVAARFVKDVEDLLRQSDF
jgi:pyruvate dehydrogenase E2 component (dihydrolipoamide acetyltransferase)